MFAKIKKKKSFTGILAKLMLAWGMKSSRQDTQPWLSVGRSLHCEGPCCNIFSWIRRDSPNHFIPTDISNST